MAGSKISALTAISTVDDTDLFPIVDTSATTLKKMTRAQLRKLIADSPTDLASLRYSTGSADWLVTTPSAMITGLPAITTLAGADVLPINQSTTGSKVTVTQLRAQLPLASPADGDLTRYSADSATWVAATQEDLRYRAVSTSRYTGLLGSDNQITMSNTSDFAIGFPVSYVESGTTYYGICTALSANSAINVTGPRLNSGFTISSLKVGCPGLVHHIQFFISGAYGDGANDLLATDMKQYYKWLGHTAYLVSFTANHNTAAGTTQPKINVKAGGNLVSTLDTNNGIQLQTAGTWVPNPAVSLNATNYKVSNDEAIEIACTVAGNPTGGALNLTVICTLVESISNT